MRLSVSVFTVEVLQSLMGSERVDPSIDCCVDKICIATEPFFELQWSCVDRLMAKVRFNYECLFSVTHGISKNKLGILLEQ